MSTASERANQVGPRRPDRGAPAPDGAPLPEDLPTAAERFRPLSRLVLTGALIALCLLLAYPFLPAITWAVALAIIAWPLHAWLCRYVARPWLAAGITSFVVVIVILVPLLWVSYRIALEAGNAADRVQQNAGGEVRVRETMIQAPYLRDAVLWGERFGLDVDREVRKAVSAATSELVGVTQGSIAAAFQAILALFILYHLFLGRGELMRGLRSVLPLTQAESDQVFSRAADSVYANLYANTLTSLIDGIGGGLVFWWIGLPSPVLWGTVLFVLSFLPAVGTAFVWVPVATYLVLTGQVLEGAILTGWGMVSGAIVGNLIYIRLAGNRLRLHDVIAMVGYFGGLAIFGVSGIILGPALFAVTAAVLEVWRNKPATEEEALPVVAASPAPPA
jgi:predicted PurR-regulated permease PerM